MNSFTLRQKLYLGFISLVALALLCSVVSLWQISSMHGDFKTLVQQSDAKGELKEQKAGVQRMDEHYADAVAVNLTLTGAAVGLGLLLAFLITRDAMRQLGGDPSFVKAVVERITRGNFSESVYLHEEDRASLLAAMVAMQAELGGTIQRARSGAQAIASASTQIAQGNTELSGRTEEQASSLQETASAMEELASTVGHNAENARQASQLADEASAVARTGGETVKRVVSTMTDIAASSQRIQEIIGVIDGIAFQTNILALNAAVEAARAGEQGRGFAVVAAEVRSLAQRSAEAAKEIKVLITESVEKVGSGADLVQSAGAQMDEIVTAVARVTDIVGEIASASAEQSAGINQVNQAITQMDHTTQQNAALVEQVAAAAANLQEQSKDLVAAVSVFVLEPAKHGLTRQWDGHTERRGANRATNIKRIYGHDGKRLVEPAAAVDARGAVQAPGRASGLSSAAAGRSTTAAERSSAAGTSSASGSSSAAGGHGHSPARPAAQPPLAPAASGTQGHNPKIANDDDDWETF